MSEATARVRYRERAKLSVEDLASEQHARLSARWRHQISEHDWGIALGLAIQAEDVELTIQPGLAVDGFGRELVLAKSLVYVWDGWDEQGRPGEGERRLFDLLGEEPRDQSRWADLWLLWDLQADDPPAKNRRPSGIDRRKRWLEIPRLRITPATARAIAEQNEDAGTGNQPSRPDRYTDVYPAGSSFNGTGYLPDDPQQEWPVFLGRVRETQESEGVFHYTIEPIPARPYVRLRGETVTAVSRLAQMQLSSSPGRSQFAVALPSADVQLQTFDTTPLAINQPGDLVTRGNTHLFADEFNLREGDVTVENRPDVMANEVRSVSYLVEKLTSDSDPVVQEVFNGLPGDVREILLRIDRGEEQVTWVTRQRIAAALSEVLRKGLPVDLVLSSKTGLNMRRLPSRFRQRAVKRRNLRRRPLPGQNLPAGETFAIDTASSSDSERTSPQEARELLNHAIPGLLTESSADQQTHWGVEFHPLANLPTEAAPWQLYHAVVPQNDREIHQLRLELEHPGDKGDPRLHRFVIGHRKGGDAFQECLIVQADGNVILLGQNVYVTGRVVEGPIQADPRDPRFGAALIQEASRGVSTSTLLTATIIEKDGAWVYEVKNDSTRTFTCSPVFENIMKDRDVIRQGPVGGPFRLESKQFVDVPLNPSGLSDEVTITILVMAADQSNNITKVQSSQRITF